MTRNDVTHGTDFSGNVPGQRSLEAECRALGIDPFGVLDFSASINPLGPPRCLEKVLDQAVKLAGAYPDPQCTEARAALARAHNVQPETILLGNGATELLYLVTRSFHADKTLVLAPSCGDYVRAAGLAGSLVELSLAWQAFPP